MKNLKQNPILKYITIFIALNALIGIVLSFYLFLIMNQDNITLVVGVALMLLLSSVTFVVTFYCLKCGGYNRLQFAFILVICFLQAFLVFTNGFCFKYTQALEWVGFYCINDSIEGTGFVLASPVLNANTTLTLKETNSSLYGINVFFLIIFFYLISLLFERAILENKNQPIRLEE